MADIVDSDENAVPARLEGKRFGIVVCWFLGFGCLVSWNSMLTIADYYYQLFPDYHPSRVLTLVYQPFAFGLTALYSYHEAKLNTRIRNLTGYILFFLSTLGLLVLDIGTGGKGGVGNFIGVCIFVAGFGVADATTQGGVVGDLAFMCPEFLQSFFAGLAASGAVTSGLRLVTKAAFDKSPDGLRKGVILFLAIAALFEFLCIFLYAFVFVKLPIVKYYRKKAAMEGSKTVTSDLASAGIHVKADETDVSETKLDRLSNKDLIYQNWDYALDLYVVYAITLSIFPGFLFENTGTHHSLGTWYGVVLVAAYNFLDLMGRYTPLIDCIRIENRKGITFATFARLVLIPCFYFASKYAADQGYMIFLVSVLGLTNGHLTVCILRSAPKGYKAPEQNAMGNLLVMFILGGIFTGVVLDWLWLIGNGPF